MKKRFISALLTILIVISALLCLGGCKSKDDNFPVTIGHTKISEKPANVAVLSDNLADMILYMDGFLTQICAISDSCTQTELKTYVESVGSETNPSVDALVRSGAEYVLTDIPLSDTIKDKLADKDITVINFMVPQDEEQLATIYTTLGTFLGGNPSGKEAGASSYERLINTISSAKNSVSFTDDINRLSLCYLYLNDKGELCSINSSSCYGMILNELGITNISGIFTDAQSKKETVNTKNLRLANPVYIFYDNADVLDYLKNDTELSTLAALKENNICQIPKRNLERLGSTLISTQQSMLNFIYGDTSVSSSPDESQAVSYAAEYGIDIDNADIYKNGDDNNNIQIIQQRLMDLEYLVLEDSTPTTYFGDKTEAAVRDFQQANGIEATGIVNRTTIEKLFRSTTLSKSGIPIAPAIATTEPTAPTDNTDTPAVTPNPDYANKDYNIDLSAHKAYGPRDDGTRDQHEDIMVIQERLCDLGYFTPEEAGVYTDYYGNGTEAAFREFEAANGLEVNGFAGYDNLLLLFSNEAVPNN